MILPRLSIFQFLTAQARSVAPAVVRLGAALVLLAALASCADDKEAKNEPSFDRGAMLANYADSLIIPALTRFEASALALHQQAESYASNPLTQDIAALRSAWIQAATAWQWAAPYNFGPATLPTGPLWQEIATFPANAAGIEQYVSASDFSLNNFQRDTRGLFAVEYLIFGPEASKLAEESSRRQYLLALTARLRDLARQTREGWGSYRALFVGSVGTDAGSSTTTLFNEFNTHYELLKNYKFGLPLGQRAGQTQAEPQRVEAYYSGQSWALAREHMKASENVWRGRSQSGSDGLGFDDYLKTAAGGSDVAQQTVAQLRIVWQALDAMPNEPPLADQIRGGGTQAMTVFTELSKLTRFFKSEISSRLGLAITYSSGDGD